MLFGQNCKIMSTTFKIQSRTHPLQLRPQYQVLAPVVERSDNTIHWINLYPVGKAICFAITYPSDSDLSVGLRYPPFKQLGPGPN